MHILVIKHLFRPHVTLFYNILKTFPNFRHRTMPLLCQKEWLPRTLPE